MGAVVLVLALGGLATWWFWLRGDSRSTTADSPSPTATRTPEPKRTTGAPTTSPTTPGEATTPAALPKGARIRYDTAILGPEWLPMRSKSVVPFDMEHKRATERDSNGRSLWIAYIACGTVPSSAAKGSLEAQAEAISDIQVKEGFTRTRVSVEPVDSGPVTVAGRKAYLLKQNFRYTYPKVKATSDEVTIIVIDLGPDNPPGVFISAVPNTHRQLAPVIGKTIAALRIS